MKPSLIPIEIKHLKACLTDPKRRTDLGQALCRQEEKRLQDLIAGVAQR
ncbi:MULTISPECIES: hypothetical protein [unclassified Bradyrhizobium]|nr:MULTISPECIES: hypothetical protein [unclassified Bradyrhizobium]